MSPLLRRWLVRGEAVLVELEAPYPLAAKLCDGTDNSRNVCNEPCAAFHLLCQPDESSPAFIPFQVRESAPRLDTVSFKFCKCECKTLDCRLDAGWPTGSGGFFAPESIIVGSLGQRKSSLVCHNLTPARGRAPARHGVAVPT